ncbi:hypothetical protein V6N13_046832 [Hibiscus sabdariffa]|uniref:Uncharacterized protein n=1 Tax=Hibiscus sabdariffa TaxID=183260 RepID=A0ABR2B7L3_9ROSI
MKWERGTNAVLDPKTSGSPTFYYQKYPSMYTSTSTRITFPSQTNAQQAVAVTSGQRAGKVPGWLATIESYSESLILHEPIAAQQAAIA